MAAPDGRFDEGVRLDAESHPLDAHARRRHRGRAAAAVLVALGLPWAAVAVDRGTDHPASPVAGNVVPAADSGVAAMYLRPSVSGDVSAPKDPAPAPARPAPAAGVPTRIVVPALGVDSPVVPISGADGTLIPPSDPTSIGWWREGPRAGTAYGSTVLTGHTVHTGGGAFDALGRLVAGDTVLVRTGRGWLHYRVEDAVAYRKGRLARDARAIFTTSGPGRLVLVTCSNFDGTEYLANTVVYATPVSG